MVLKGSFAALLGVAVLAWSGMSVADEYRPDEFLLLNLPKAVFSPKPLGPSARFEPVPVEASTDRKAQATPAAKADAVVKVTRVHAVKRHGPTVSKPTPTRQAHRHGNPLDAQAFDTRIQVWPCRSGGICNWQRH
jgi:hypothetical protein